MSFVDRFYSFSIDLAAIDRNIFEKIRIKVPKYPNEELTSVMMRVLMYIHCWSPGLQISANPQNSEEATLFERDHSDNFTKWITTGIPDLKALRLAVRRFPECSFAIYFQNGEQISRFCHLLRGTRENWISPVHFLLIPPEPVQKLVELLQSSNQWQITESDQILFMEVQGAQIEIPLISIDIWHEYQASLLTIEAE